MQNYHTTHTYLLPLLELRFFFFLLPKIGIQNNPAISFPIFKGNVFSIFGDARNSVVGCLLHWICIIPLILFLVPLKFAPKKKSEPRDEAFISLKKKYLHPRIFPVKVCLLRWMPVRASMVKSCKWYHCKDVNASSPRDHLSKYVGFFYIHIWYMFWGQGPIFQK